MEPVVVDCGSFSFKAGYANPEIDPPVVSFLHSNMFGSPIMMEVMEYQRVLVNIPLHY